MPHVEDSAAFPAREHLKSSIAIKEVMDADENVFAYPIKCYYRIAPQMQDTNLQFAVMVPKKRFPHAVDRNRLKRLLRECYRHGKFGIAVPSGQTLQLCWILVAGEMPTYDALQKASLAIFDKLSHLLASQES
ncbi:MAG: ribonuclease P protein component [Bacteroidales bacterium]|nr:ribonuclease P protein component [Bacteroidales bacterium]